MYKYIQDEQEGIDISSHLLTVPGHQEHGRYSHNSNTGNTVHMGKIFINKPHYTGGVPKGKKSQLLDCEGVSAHSPKNNRH